jgi:hypothetical protein
MIKEQITLTQDYVREIFDYDPSTGVVTRKKSVSQNTKVGQQAGTVNGHGYLAVRVFSKTYSLHRIIWLYVYGQFPSKDIDHINRNRLDNRLLNLRQVDRIDNCRNISRPKHNTSGCMGVSWYGRDKKWNVYIKVDGKNKWLGRYDTIFDAAAVRRSAENHIYKLPRPSC